ncbi:MAG: poly-gamma-glutamate synthase PgsB [Chloroflexota bacterium]|nr:poly-gamma-glutamate synthase PgsB [Chloroflexota bacterium]
MIGFVMAALILMVLMYYWHRSYRQHETRIQQLPVRIHVNGIRGKSTVTRLVAGVLREGGFETVAKTTGSAARIIHEDGNESPIKRRGAATIVEQIEIVRQHVKPTTEALMIECMAVNPLYQKVSQEQIVKGNITVITNVREDHQDVMGESLEEIADSLATTIPRGGLLITAEEREHLRERLANIARSRGSDFLYADPEWVTDEDLAGFQYLSFKENLAIGLAIARILDIPRDVAMKGMQRAIPDIGVVFVQQTTIKDKEVVWAPLFAVNDRESTIMGVEALRPYHKPDATRVGVLNNRYDRAMRAIQFAEIAARDLQLDYYITFGAYEDQVTDKMVEIGTPREHIINLGFSKNPTLEQILDQVVALAKGDQVLLIGMVNIHTPQAELLMEFFHHLKEEQRATTALVADFEHVPESVRRRRYLISHLLRSRAETPNV